MELESIGDGEDIVGLRDGWVGEEEVEEVEEVVMRLGACVVLQSSAWFVYCLFMMLSCI